ncbi:MAG: NUDIX hydrolase [Gammaproteobacteria bacterium]|nr:NUDIX hydrolase [Gammaproteobacteria bacterium]MBK7728858.1 NUDIX hydrolase [Gammaproteobacteria bacterium]
MQNRQWIPHVTVATVVFHEERYLLVEELENGRHVFNQPAGHLEAGETLSEAAARETLEETGWEVQIEAVLGASLFHNKQTGISYYRTSFLARPLRHHASRTLDSEIVAPRWMSYRDIIDNRARLRSESVLATIEQHRSGHRFPLHFFYPQHP